MAPATAEVGADPPEQGALDVAATAGGPTADATPKPSPRVVASKKMTRKKSSVSEDPTPPAAPTVLKRAGAKKAAAKPSPPTASTDAPPVAPAARKRAPAAPHGQADESNRQPVELAPANAGAAAAEAASAEPARPAAVRVRAGKGGARAAGKGARGVRVPRETYPEPLQSLVEVGRRHLGIVNLRPGQAEALTHIMAKRDLLAVMPTGSGKSLLYQLPSLVLDGLTVVISPLIALIKDQLDKMNDRGLPVCRFDSTLTVRQRRAAEELVLAPGGKLVFVTPEGMSDPAFRTFLRGGAGGEGVSMFVVDEAHCVSQWGHDFRPAYLNLRQALEELGRPPVLATTATAPPHVREDIAHQLGIEDAAVVTTTFERPNLHFEVLALPGEDDKQKTLVTLLKKLPRPGVVYCATVKKVDELHESLLRHGIPVAHYHGRMSKKDRDSEQQRFMEAKDLIMLATNAFGLGVDKANIRYVLHYHVPGSLEAYAQEAGRGGRDGKPARCVLLFSPDDVAIQEYFLTGTYPSRRQVRAIYKTLVAWSPQDEAPPTISNLALSSRVGAQRTRTVLSLLEDEGFVVERDEGHYWLADPPPSPEAVDLKARQYDARRIADRQRLDALLRYVRTPECRNQVILDYLGEPDTPTCGRCDNCQRSQEAAQAAADQASRLEARVTAGLDQDWEPGEETVKPRRVIRHRVIRIDEPEGDAEAATGEPTPSAEAQPAIESAPAPTAAPAQPSAAASPAAAAPVAEAAPLPAPAEAPSPTLPGNGVRDEEVDDEGADDVVDGEPIEDDEYEDDEYDDDEYDDDEYDDDDDDEYDDDEYDDDDDDDDEYDDDDYELIERTAAALAEEGYEDPDAEITILARKRVEKIAQVDTPKDPDAAARRAAERARRRRKRRRRRKKRSMLPPKSAFTSPVLSKGEAPPPSSSRGRRKRGGSGPLIEYVRGPLRINMTPVASATPNDVAPSRKKKKRRRRVDGDGVRPEAGADTRRAESAEEELSGRRRRRRRRKRKRGLARTARQEGPVSFFSTDKARGSDSGRDDAAKRRRRRRRRRRARGGQDGQSDTPS
ncbi:RecQ family ATP-dependent DNA helicase [Haliangium sp.]|uniref:RecQ family ATP-dependent DNA helicase n=1 Tax=Haliangium sp. TaxID=2663208 RepID=UPI003D0EDFBA